MKRLQKNFLILFLATSIHSLYGMEVHREFTEVKSERSESPSYSLTSHSPIDPKIIAATQRDLHQPVVPPAPSSLHQFSRPVTSTAPTFIDLASLKSEQTDLAAVQGAYHPDTTTPVAYHPEIMNAPIEDYVAMLHRRNAAAYPKITSATMDQILETYTVDFIDSQSKGILGGTLFGFNKVPVDAIRIDTNWKRPNPTRSQKIAAGLDALNELRANPLFNQIYTPTTQNKFMSQPASAYFLALHEKFPHVSDDILATYVTKFLNDNNNQYHNKTFAYVPIPGTQDLNNPIKTKVSDILQNPGWDSHTETEGTGEDRTEVTIYHPSSLQKLYAAIQAIEEIHASYHNQGGAIATPSISAGIATTRKALANPKQYARSLVNYDLEKGDGSILLSSLPTLKPSSDVGAPVDQSSFFSSKSTAHVQARLQSEGQHLATQIGITAPIDRPGEVMHQVVNIGVQKLTPAITDLLSQPSDPHSQPLFDSESKEAISTGYNAVKRTVYETVGSMALSSTAPKDSSTQAPLPSTWLVDDADTIAAREKMQQDLAVAGGNLATTGIKAVAGLLGIDTAPVEEVKLAQEDKPVINPLLEGTEFIRPEEDLMKASEEEKSTTTVDPQSNEKKADVVTTSRITTYIANKFRNAVRSIKTPEQLKVMIRTIISTLARLAGYPPEITPETEAIINERTQAASDPETGFLGRSDLDDANFDKRFNLWIKDLVASFYKFIKVNNPADIQVIQIEKTNSDPLTPKIALNYNTSTKIMRSATIQYNGYARTISLENIQPDENGVYTITSELFQKPKKLTTKQSLYNYLMKGIVIDPLLEQTEAGRGTSRTLYNSANKALVIDPNVSDGTVTITYDTKTNAITTSVTKRMPDTAEVTTTKEYSTKSIAQNVETVTVAPAKGGGLALADIFTPTVTMEYLPYGGVKSSGALRSALVTYTDPIAKKDFSIPVVIRPENYDPTTGTYTIEASLKDKPQEKPKPTGMVATIIAAIPDSFLSQITGVSYEAGLKSLESVSSVAAFKATYPEAYNQAVQYLLAPAQKVTEHIIIEYNPVRAKTVTTTVETRMSDGKVQISKNTYPIS